MEFQIGRRGFLKGVGRTAAMVGAGFHVFPRQASAGALSERVIFNVVHASRIHLLASAGVTTFLKVDVLPSQSINGMNVTAADFPVLSDGPLGLWEVPAGRTIAIRIPAQTTEYDFTKGGFGAVRATAVDAGGNPSGFKFMAHVALRVPDHVSPVSGIEGDHVGTVFRIPLVGAPLGGQTAMVCATPLLDANVAVLDRGTGMVLMQPTFVKGAHSLLFEGAVEEAILIEMDLQNVPGVCSAVITRGRQRFRIYPIGL